MAPKDAPKKAAQSIRIDAERLDFLMNVVGELVIGHTRLAQLGAELEAPAEEGAACGHAPLVPTLNETIEHLARLMGDLQITVMRVRMLPIERIFNKFPRLVRDLAKQLGKEIKLEISGADTELDKTVIEELEDPLVHLLRNAADHGVEAPDVREAAGKPRQGTIRLKAHQEGGAVVLTIADDGGGIDPARVLAKARALGLAASDVAYSDAEAQQFIFRPGFSTAAQVTSVSGRGVGMDVVNANIRKIKGSIHVASRVGEGTTFLVKLPLTLMITKALLVQAGGHTYAIPLDGVRESIWVAPGEIATVQHQEVIRLRGRVVPLLRLSAFFGFPPSAGRPDGSWPVVVVGGEDRQVGLVVDALDEQQDVVIKSLGHYLGAVRGVAGATILGDGRVALVLDLAALVEGVAPVGDAGPAWGAPAAAAGAGP